MTRVITKSGLELEADAVVMGTGAVPDVMLARAAGLELGESGGVRVDSRLQTAVPGIYAAGDIAEYRERRPRRPPLRIEHWDVALNQGKAAALNMLGRDQPYDVVPYFFSDLADWASLEYVGPACDWDQEVVRGSVEEGEFSVWYLSEGRVAAALSVGRSDDLEHARRLISAGTALALGAEALGQSGRRPGVALIPGRGARLRRVRLRRARAGTDPASRCAAAGEPVDQPAEAIDRALQRSRHLDRALQCGQHADQLSAGLGDPARAVDDLSAAIVDPVPKLDDVAASVVDPVSEGSHLHSELQQIPCPDVELLTESHHCGGAAVQSLGNLEHRSADRGHLLAQVHQPLQLCGGGRAARATAPRSETTRLTITCGGSMGRPRRRSPLTLGHGRGMVGRSVGAVTSAGERLRGKDSNLEFQGQNLASCHYSTPQ